MRSGTSSEKRLLAGGKRTSMCIGDGCEVNSSGRVVFRSSSGTCLIHEKTKLFLAHAPAKCNPGLIHVIPVQPRPLARPDASPLSPCALFLASESCWNCLTVCFTVLSQSHRGRKSPHRTQTRGPLPPSRHAPELGHLLHLPDLKVFKRRSQRIVSARISVQWSRVQIFLTKSGQNAKLIVAAPDLARGPAFREQVNRKAYRLAQASCTNMAVSSSLPKQFTVQLSCCHTRCEQVPGITSAVAVYHDKSATTATLSLTAIYHATVVATSRLQ